MSALLVKAKYENSHVIFLVQMDSYLTPQQRKEKYERADSGKPSTLGSTRVLDNETDQEEVKVKVTARRRPWWACCLCGGQDNNT